VLAAWLLQLMYGGILNGAIEPTPEVSLWVAMLTEAVLTLGLVSVILGTASGARNVGINGAIAIGACIGLVSVWAAPVSGASMNPARLFGPELVGWDLTDYWIYLVGPIIGAMVAVGFEWILKGKATTAGAEAAQGILDKNPQGLTDSGRPIGLADAPADKAPATASLSRKRRVAREEHGRGDSAEDRHFRRP
jgi:aquaporin Z